MNHLFSKVQSVAILSLVKLFERASYYGMRALLILYAVDEIGLGLDSERAFYYYGFFTAGIYLFSIPMAVISDFILKQKNGTLVGLLFLIVGYGVLIIPSFYAAIAALLLISVGAGFVNPNMTVLVGRLFKKQDEKRNIGFVIYLTAINIGSFIGVLLLGYIGETFGFRYGFGLAALSTLIALIMFLVAKNSFDLIETNETEMPATSVDSRPDILDYKVEEGSTLKQHSPPSLPHLRQENQNTKSIERIILILILAIVSVVFWQLYEMSTYQFYFKFSVVESLRATLGLSIPESFVYSIQSVFIIPVTILGVLLLYYRIIKSSINIIAVAFILMALNMALIHLWSNESDVSVLGITALSFMIISIAEWFITAISLSYVTRLSHVKYSSIIVAVFSAITFLGGRAISYLGFNFEEPNLLLISIIPVLIGVVFLGLRKVFLQLTGGVD